MLRTTVTVSSESAYDAVSTRSESLYSPPTSSYSSYSSTFPSDLDMEFQRIRVGDVSDYSAQQGITTVDPNSFGPLPPTPPRSPPVHNAKPYDKPYQTRTSYSDYTPARRSSISSDYYAFGYNQAIAQSTVSPSHISAQLPVVSSLSQVGQRDADPRRKYKCTTCPRGKLLPTARP